MKLTTDVKTLSAALSVLRACTGTRTTIPALTCVRLEAAPGQPLRLAGNNLDLQMETAVEADTEKGGEVLIPGGRMAEVLKRMDLGAPLSVTADAKFNVTLAQNGQRSMKLPGLSVEEFAPLAKIGDGPMLAFAPEELTKAMATLLPFASDDGTRYVLCGVRFESDEKAGMLKLVTTDGRRLRLWHRESAVQGVDCIIPTEMCRVMQSLGGAACELRLSETMAELTAGAWRVGSKLIEGNFPHWRQVVPDRGKKELVFDRDALLEAVGFAEMASTDKSNSVKLVSSKKSLEITANTPDYGDAMAVVQGGSGDAPTAAYNPRYLREMVATFPPGEMRITMADEMAPALMENAEGLGVLMPMRVS